jgi:LmbE family N-acetylglucosaminyl deacetylase
LITLATLILAACCVAALFVLLKAWRRRASLYRYKVRTDQRYDFSRSGASQISGRIVNGNLVVAPPQPGGAILLQLRVRSTLLGRWFEPCIEMELGRPQRRFRQPFERGAAGSRYIDLSPIVVQGEATLRLRGHHLKIIDQAVVLHYLPRAVDLASQKILVIGTHPDDAEIAAFGLYADRNAYVVTLTAGEAGEPGPFRRFGDSAAHLEKGRNRAWNSVTVPMLGGLAINRTANLGFFDGTLPAMKDRPETAVKSMACEAQFLDAFGQFHDPGLVEPRRGRAATWANLVSDLEHLVKTLQPDILVTPYPRLDWHPDHKLSTVALFEALKNLDWRHGSLLLYTNHFVSSDHYPFGNAGELVSLPPGVDGIFFDGIVSNPLDPQMQARKHMALDAMIDLRPDIQAGSVHSVAASFASALKATITGGRLDYFRQAVRANELFFEVRVSSLYEPGVQDRILG